MQTQPIPTTEEPQKQEPTQPNPEISEANPKTPQEYENSEAQPSSPPLYFSQLPIEQRSNIPITMLQELFNLTPTALDVLPKPRVSKHRSLEVSISKSAIEAP